jgi:hypothetical protein
MRSIILLVFLLLSATISAQELFEDGNTSIKKGNVFISTTFSINHKQSENEVLLLQTLDESYSIDWNITLRSGYFIKDQFAVGAFFKYGNQLNKLSYTGDNGKVNDDRLENSYSFAPFIRNYLPLGNGRFCLFNETNLEFTYSSSVRQIADLDDVNRTVGESYQLKLGIQPGVAAFITKGISVEVGTSLLGLSTKYTTSVVNGDEENKGYTFSNDVSFKIDLFSLFLGITFYFPVK